MFGNKGNMFKKLAMRATAAMLGVVAAVPIALYIPWVQNKVADAAAEYASNKTGMDISVGDVRVRFPLDVSATDVQVIDRGDFKFVCCVNMGDRATRHATLQIFAPERTGAFRVTDPLSKREIGTFTVEELAAGIPIDLPSQERVLRVLERIR